MKNNYTLSFKILKNNRAETLFQNNFSKTRKCRNNFAILRKMGFILHVRMVQSNILRIERNFIIKILFLILYFFYFHVIVRILILHH